MGMSKPVALVTVPQLAPAPAVHLMAELAAVQSGTAMSAVAVPFKLPFTVLAAPAAIPAFDAGPEIGSTDELEPLTKGTPGVLLGVTEPKPVTPPPRPIGTEWFGVCHCATAGAAISKDARTAASRNILMVILPTY